MTSGHTAGIVFLGYIAAVFTLAAFSHRLLRNKSFLGEYFLGSRGLGTWALAFTFAATSASGGSFTGYPAVIYTYGWVLILWVGMYMVWSLVTMGLLGKRLNQVARRAGALTIPDVIRERYQSPGLALFATLTILVFTTANLVAQFKAGGVILDVLFRGIPGYEQKILPHLDRCLAVLPLQPEGASAGYLAALLIFALVVVLYTGYGGFRAVVWTDVMQGVVMAAGVLLLLPFTISHVGGLDDFTRALGARPPRLVIGLVRDNNALEYWARTTAQGELYVEHLAVSSDASVIVQDDREKGAAVVSVRLATDGAGQVITTARQVGEMIAASDEAGALVRLRVPPLPDPRTGQARNTGGGPAAVTDGPLYLAAGADMVFGPSHRPDGTPFLALGLLISFLIMDPLGAAGQPAMMVRLMAFRDSRVLRRAMFTVSIYYALIYTPLIIIFVAAQAIVHPAELSEGSDQIMPVLAARVAPAWLAGVLIAAPFAAIMSTVDSLLLLVSSALVRDIGQRMILPDLSPSAAKVASHTCTVLIGALVTLLAFNPPELLLYVILFAMSGFACTFLAPISLGIYWKRMTTLGAWGAMLGGFTTVVGLFSAGKLFSLWGFDAPARIDLLGFHPMVVGLAVSFALGIGISLLDRRPPEKLVRRFFAPEGDESS